MYTSSGAPLISGVNQGMRHQTVNVGHILGEQCICTSVNLANVGHLFLLTLYE